MPITDREEARARLDAIASEELVAQNDLQIARTALADLIGAGADRLHRLAADASLEGFRVETLQAWTERAAQHNLLIAMQELGRDIARDEVDKFRALTSPSLDVVAQVAADRMHGDNGFGVTNITSTTRTIGVQLTIPLFTGGMRSAKHDEAAALAEKARFDVDALRQLVRRQTQAAWLGVTTGAAQVQAHAQALRSAQSRLGATETGAEVGARTTLDLVNAQADFYRAQRDLAQARYRLLLDRLALAATAGELTDADLKEVNARLVQ
jgi:outer membrane protein